MSLFDGSGDDRTRGPWRGITAGMAAVSVAVALLVVLALSAIVGLRSGGAFGTDDGGGDDDSVRRRAAPVVAPAAVTPTTIVPPVAPVVAVHVVAGRHALAPPPVLDRVVDGDVVDVTASGFFADATGEVMVCRPEGAHARSSTCGRGYPVRTDGRGRARFQYQLLHVAACGRDDGCTLVVDVDEVQGVARLVVGDEGPVPARVAAASSSRGRDTVEVDVTGAVPGHTAAVLQCPARATATTACHRAGRPMLVRPDGTAHTTVPLAPSTRRLVVVDGTGIVVAPPVTLRALRSPIVHYDPARVAAGILLAIALAALAIALVRATDWRPPAEAATPDLDQVSLATEA
jgi:hypothetical protein